MEKKKLLVADSTRGFCTALEATLRDEFCVRIATDGREARELMDSFAPDVLVLDVMLPGLDGISVLAYAAKRGHKLATLVTTSVRSEYIFARLMQFGVSYVLMKPCCLEVAAERVREIAAAYSEIAVSEPCADQNIAQILLDLGANPKHNGYHYLCDAIKTYAEDNTQSLTKELYVAVGTVYGVGWQQVERSIRAALESAWKKRNENVWRRWFPAGMLSALKRPTNGEVICRLAEYYLLKKTRKIG